MCQENNIPASFHVSFKTVQAEREKRKKASKEKKEKEKQYRVRRVAEKEGVTLTKRGRIC